MSFLRCRLLCRVASSRMLLDLLDRVTHRVSVLPPVMSSQTRHLGPSCDQLTDPDIVSSFRSGKCTTIERGGVPAETERRIRSCSTKTVNSREYTLYCSSCTAERPQVSDNMSRPLRLTSLRLSPPPQHTRTSFLDALVKPFLSQPHPSLPVFLNPAPPQPRTLHDILLTTRALVGHLERFDIFKMDQLGVRLEPRRGGDADEVEMVLELREQGRLFFKAGTEIGGGEGGAVSALYPDMAYGRM